MALCCHSTVSTADATSENEERNLLPRSELRFSESAMPSQRTPGLVNGTHSRRVLQPDRRPLGIPRSPRTGAGRGKRARRVSPSRAGPSSAVQVSRNPDTADTYVLHPEPGMPCHTRPLTRRPDHFRFMARRFLKNRTSSATPQASRIAGHALIIRSEERDCDHRSVRRPGWPRNIHANSTPGIMNKQPLTRCPHAACLRRVSGGTRAMYASRQTRRMTPHTIAPASPKTTGSTGRGFAASDAYTFHAIQATPVPKRTHDTVRAARPFIHGGTRRALRQKPAQSSPGTPRSAVRPCFCFTAPVPSRRLPARQACRETSPAL